MTKLNLLYNPSEVYGTGQRVVTSYETTAYDKNDSSYTIEWNCYHEYIEIQKRRKDASDDEERMRIEDEEFRLYDEHDRCCDFDIFTATDEDGVVLTQDDVELIEDYGWEIKNAQAQ